MLRRLARFFVLFALLLVVLAVAAGFFARWHLRRSLPITTGERTLAGLNAPVTVARDALGIPLITAASRVDAARALGFVHAQERFFQMDLQRRQPAGELAALVGVRAVAVDRLARVYRMRRVAEAALQGTPPTYRALLEAYADGVNAGLAALDASSFEYGLLRVSPEPWKPEDSILTVLAMFNTLQGRQMQFEATLGTMHDVLPQPLYEFLAARGSAWDAPISGVMFPRPPIPGPEVFDLRKRPQAANLRNNRNDPSLRSGRPPNDGTNPWTSMLSAEEAVSIGSNNWVVGGAHTATGAALVANDMHLAINVPNIWYRATLMIVDQAPEPPRRLAGVTLPGLPSLVVGSNGHVAWGFTNSGGDWSDLVVIDPDPRDRSRYLTPSGPQPFESHEETIAVAHADAQTTTVRATIWGPIVAVDTRGRELAQKWVALDPSVLTTDATRSEEALSVNDAIARFAGIGIPGQNVVMGDRDGHIGWVIGGPIPKRFGHDGVLPASWADGTKGWDGYLPADQFPRIIDPPPGRIWTANAPVVDGAMLEIVGEGGYADGIRARIIKDRLLAIDKATPRDMLEVQLDANALYHERWRALLLQTLTPEVVQGDPRRAEFRRLIDTTWTGRASVESVGYRLVRAFRQELLRQVFAALSAPMLDADPSFDYGRTFRSEGPLWQLVTERPLHLLAPTMRSWEAQMLAALDQTIAELIEGNRALGDRTWGEFNRAAVFHPLASAVPFFGRWLRMPEDALNGDIYTPRAHSPRAGPSERIIVSPGREEEGLAHMPTGQSGHPLSPHFRDQQRAWLTGEPLPLLPGQAVEVLTLRPVR
jgi:penicillin amidase